MSKKAILILTTALLLVTSAFSQENEPGRILEIKGKWKLLQSFVFEKRFDVTPLVIPPFRTGKLNKQFLYDGLHYLEFIRFIAGIPYKIELDSALTLQAQHGAVLLAANKQLSHAPRKPAGMSDDFYIQGCNATESSNLYTYSAETSLRSVLNGFMDDSDPDNIAILGHRRWLLNPSLQKTGFGYALSLKQTSFSTVQVFDKSRTEPFEYDFIAWPARDYCPTLLFRHDQAWSVSLNPQKYNAQQTKNIVVTLTRKSDKKRWTFDANKPVTSLDFFTVNVARYGVPFCIIFRPDYLNPSLANETFVVKVEGVLDKDGKSCKIEYSTTFFELD
jgi:hypothetical protein